MYQSQELAAVCQEATRPLAVGRAMAKCYLCGDLIPADDAPLCPDCERDEAEKWSDYRAEQEQARRPF